MTGFAALKGFNDTHDWTWEIRSVNAKGLDVRMRVPDWIDGLEAAVRSAASKRAGRGTLNIACRVNARLAMTSLQINTKAAEQAVRSVAQINDIAETLGATLSNVSAVDILNFPGVSETSEADEGTKDLQKDLLSDLDTLLDDFVAMRAHEGRALHDMLSGILTDIEALVAKAKDLAEARKGKVEETLRTNLARVLDNADGADETRVAQELAMLAVKADVTEEIDRLNAHIGAARDLIASDGPVGRKLDFLSQEFNREANTLCSKSQDTDLTTVGLDLKAAIEQMREQVQNVE